MSRWLIKHKTALLVIFLLIIGAFLRLYNLNWGAPYYFNPDERQNVVYPVLESKSIFMLDQKNFDTGTFPLIIIKLLYTGVQQLVPNPDPTQTVMLIGRGLSAVISVAISLLLFVIIRKIYGHRKGLIALALATFSTGFIQFAHFATIELWEALFFLILFYYAWRLSKHGRLADTVICGVILGVAVSTKILSAILAPAILASFLLFSYQKLQTKSFARVLEQLILSCIVFGITSLSSFAITSHPLLSNFSDAQKSLGFESDVALGKLPVFYTQGFFDTIPVVFQFTDVYPLLLNPLITILFAISLVYVMGIGIKKRNYGYLLVGIFFLLLFISQSFFFVKWVRYMVPTLPFVYIILALALGDLLGFTIKKRKKHTRVALATIGVAVGASIFFSVVFFVSTYLKTPTPVAAATFAKGVMPADASIMTEPYDLGITPFHATFPRMVIFNFYDLDNNSPEFNEQTLSAALGTTDYIVLPSQRLVRSRLANPERFPKGHAFYSKLLNGQLGYQKIYETPCDIYCRTTYLGDPVYNLEETASVFDRPTVMIFKKAQ